MWKTVLLLLVALLLVCVNGIEAVDVWKGEQETCFHNSGFYPSPKCRIHCLREKHFSATCDNLGRCFCLRKKPENNV